MDPYESKLFEQWMNPDKPIIQDLHKKIVECALKTKI